MIMYYFFQTLSNCLNNVFSSSFGCSHVVSHLSINHCRHRLTFWLDENRIFSFNREELWSCISIFNLSIFCLIMLLRVYVLMKVRGFSRKFSVMHYFINIFSAKNFIGETKFDNRYAKLIRSTRKVWLA